MGDVVTLSHLDAAGYPSMRTIDSTRSGVLWAVTRNPNANRSRLWRSTNGGNTWSLQVNFDGARGMSLCIKPGPDGRDWLGVGYILDHPDGTDSARCKVYRLFGGGTDIREIDLSVQLQKGPAFKSRASIELLTLGSNCYATVAWSQTNGFRTRMMRGQTRWTSSKAFGPSNVGFLHSWNNTDGAPCSPTLSARRSGLHPHSQPDMFVTWSQDHASSNDNKRVYWVRLQNSGATWAARDVQVVYQGGYAAYISSVWTGRDHVTVFAADDEPETVRCFICGATGQGRFQTDPPPLNDGDIRYISVAADPDSNDFWVLAAGLSSNQVSVIRYDRSEDSWDESWTVASTDVLPDDMRGTAAALTIGNTVNYLYTVSAGGGDFTVRSGTAAITNRAPHQPTWVTDGDAITADRLAALTLEWTFSDPDGDTQEAYRLRRALVTGGALGEWEWWDNPTQDWLNTEEGDLSVNTNATIPAGWADADGEVYAFQVAVRDADLYSAYSDTLYVTASSKITAAITSPAAGATVTTREFTVSWTPTAPGGALVEFLDDAGAVVWSQRTTATSQVLIRPQVANDNTYTLRLTLYSAEGLAGTPDTATVTMAWPRPPTASVQVDVLQRADTLGTVVDAGLLVTWFTATPVAGQPDAEHVDIYRYPAEDFQDAVSVPLEAMTRIATGLAIDGTFEDLSAPSDTLLAYVAVTVAADGTIARSDENIVSPGVWANILTFHQSGVESSGQGTNGFSAGADTTIARTTSEPIEGVASLEVDVTSQATAAVSTNPVFASFAAGAVRGMVTVDDRGELLEARVRIRQYDSDGVELGTAAWSGWFAQTTDPGDTPVPQQYELLVSTAANRSNAEPLAGAVLAGNAYVFVSPATSAAQVAWAVDGTPTRVDTTAPFDLIGGSTSSAQPLDTTTLPDGTHQITATVTRLDGSTQELVASFNVSNVASADTDSAGDLIGIDFDNWDYLVEPAGVGLVSVNGGAATTLHEAIAQDPDGIYRLEGVFRLVGAVTSMRGARIMGAPASEGGCVMKGSVDLGTSGWTNHGTYWSKQVAFPRLPNYGVVGGNLQAGADIAEGQAEQVWINGTTPLTPVSGNPANATQFSIGYAAGSGTQTHTVRIGVNPATVSTIELARATPEGKHFAFAGTQAFGEILNIRFDQWACPLFRSVLGSMQNLAEDGLTKNFTVRYCEILRSTGGIQMGSGWLVDRTLISDIGMCAVRGNVSNDQGELNGSEASQTRMVLQNSKITRTPFRRVRRGNEAGTKFNHTRGTHILNCLIEEMWGDALWWDFDQSNNDCLVERCKISNIAKYGLHIEMARPPTGSSKKLVFRWNDIENTGTGVMPAGHSEDMLAGDGGACVIVSSSDHVALVENRIVAHNGRSATVYAAHSGRPGITGLVAERNNLGRSGAMNRRLVQRIVQATWASNSINENRHYVPAANLEWNTFTTVADPRNFAQWQALGFDTQGVAGLTGTVPLPTQAQAHTTKHYGVV